MDFSTRSGDIERLNAHFKGIIDEILRSNVAALLGIKKATADICGNSYNLMVKDFEPTCLVDWEMTSKKVYPKGLN